MAENNFYGLLYGKVLDNADPDNMGRVKVLLETLGDAVETNWIPVLSLYASSECGAFFLPEIDDQVVVGFIADNPGQGIVIGGVWSDSQTPPETGENTGSDLNKDGENNLRFIKSRSGNMIIFDDKDGEEKLQILASGAQTRFEYLAQDEVLNIETDVDLKLISKGKLSIEAETGEFKFSKGLKIEAGGISIESSKAVKAVASQDMAIEGSMIKLN